MVGLAVGRLGVVLLLGAAVLGGLATVAAGREPGILLGSFVVAGTVLAGLAIRPRAVYLIIPVPALAYLGVAITAGLYHDRGVDTSLAALAASAVQWAGDGFWIMAAATALAVVLAVGRRLTARPARTQPARRDPGYPGDPGA